MKKMKTTIAATVALAACVGTQLFAQNVKCDNITFTMTLQQQQSVSTSTALNAGLFSQGPLYYKTSSRSLVTKDLLTAISCVMHAKGNANAASVYSPKATLQLVQGELGGFWNINDYVAQSFPDTNIFDEFGDENPGNGLTGTFNNDENADFNPYISSFYGELPSVFFPSYKDQYGFDSGGVGPFDFDDVIQNVVDNNARISISDGPGTGSGGNPAGGGAYVRLDTGRHFLPVPWANYSTSTPYNTTGEYPPGHMQPWGQIFVRDTAGLGTVDSPLCENVTFFFDLEVQECYDCFYLSSFISDSTFKNVPGGNSGPPCCSTSSQITGSGKDYYYLTLDFDNTVNNSFLNPSLATNGDDTVYYVYNYVGFTGVETTKAPADGLTPDILPYSDAIKSQLGVPSPAECRFTLHGIVTYTWSLKKINSSDTYYDYVGSARYAANGYGFISLFCGLITSATVSFTESIMPFTGCCTDIDPGWSYNWYGPGWDGGFGYFDPDYDTGDFIGGTEIYDQYNPYPFFNIVGGQQYDIGFGNIIPLYEFNLPDQYESPYNPPAALTRHQTDYGSSSIQTYNFESYIYNFGLPEESAD